MCLLYGIIGAVIGGLVGSFLFPNGKFSNPQKDK